MEDSAPTIYRVSFIIRKSVICPCIALKLDSILLLFTLKKFILCSVKFAYAIMFSAVKSIFTAGSCNLMIDRHMHLSLIFHSLIVLSIEEEYRVDSFSMRHKMRLKWPNRRSVRVELSMS